MLKYLSDNLGNSPRPPDILFGSQFIGNKLLENKPLERHHETFVYHASDGAPLTIDCFHAENKSGAAIVFFFGGGWNRGSTLQFHHQCEYFSRIGITAFSAEYRVRSRHGTTMPDAVEDACAVLNWLYENADKLGVDRTKIIVSGGSAGGQLAISSATYSSVAPAAMILFNPVLDTTRIRDRTLVPPESCQQYSPLHLVRPYMPPTLLFHGTDDSTVPFEHARQYYRLMRSMKNECKLVRYSGADHAFFNYGKHNNRYYHYTMRASHKFLDRMSLVG